MNPQKHILLFTDFGLEDLYIGLMRSVILSINPKAKIIDICHSIKAQNITHARFMIQSSRDYFPQAAIILVVVDPKVGSDRKIICVKNKEQLFIAPDNGVLSDVIDNNSVLYEITSDDYFLPTSSNTFHGRDKFAPLCAHLSNGEDIEKVSRKIDSKDIIILEPMLAIKVQDKIHGRVVHIDRFGNCISNLRKDDLSGFKEIELFDVRINKLHNTYSDVEVGDALVYIGSSGYLEFAVRNGNFAAYNSIEINDEITVSK